ncbi:hypothetical protein [uncultured Gammaproteobacteria bacterium]|nr:hypothetical protein [uncultured Gammaproteobacteria bacterium]
MEAQVLPLVKAILRFIQTDMPLLPLKLMAQSQHGVTQGVEVQTHPVHPLIKVISRFIQLVEPLPPLKPMVQLHHGVT